MSDPSNSALFSCPFCGGVAKAFAVDMSVVCIGCQAEIVATTVAEAVAAWNRRARNPAFDILNQTYDECLTPIAKAFGFSGPELDDSFLEYMLECAAELKTTDAHFQALLAEHEQIEQAVYEGHDYRFEWDPSMLPTMIRQQRTRRLRSRQSKIDMHTELLCDDCGAGYVVWFAPNNIWNLVMRKGAEHEKGAPEPYLCMACFTRRAETAFPNVSWLIAPEPQPPRPVLDASQITISALESRSEHPPIDVNAAADKINRAIFSVTGCGIE